MFFVLKSRCGRRYGDSLTIRPLRSALRPFCSPAALHAFRSHVWVIRRRSGITTARSVNAYAQMPLRGAAGPPTNRDGPRAFNASARKSKATNKVVWVRRYPSVCPGHAGRELSRRISVRLQRVPDATRSRHHGAVDRDQVRELERIWSQLDAVASDSTNRHRRPFAVLWVEHSHALMARQAKLNAEIDELESEIVARKAQLTQMRHAIAISY